MQKNLISLADGVAMTTLFRSERENILQEEFRTGQILPMCESFDRACFEMLLSNHSCKGIRIYSGMDADLKVKFIIVGIGENDEDIYITNVQGEMRIDSVIENGVRCPTMCPPPSALNS